LPKLKPLPTKRVLKALARAGWDLRPYKKGKGHYVLVNRDQPGIVTVPRHGTVRKGTLAQIIKSAGLTQNQFRRLYR